MPWHTHLSTPSIGSALCRCPTCIFTILKIFSLNHGYRIWKSLFFIYWCYSNLKSETFLYVHMLCHIHFHLTSYTSKDRFLQRQVLLVLEQLFTDTKQTVIKRYDDNNLNCPFTSVTVIYTCLENKQRNSCYNVGSV